MRTMNMFPLQTIKWRNKWDGKGWWLQCYSSLLARWCNIEYLGEELS